MDMPVKLSKIIIINGSTYNYDLLALVRTKH